MTDKTFCCPTLHAASVDFTSALKRKLPSTVGVSPQHPVSWQYALRTVLLNCPCCNTLLCISVSVAAPEQLRHVILCHRLSVKRSRATNDGIKHSAVPLFIAASVDFTSAL